MVSFRQAEAQSMKALQDRREQTRKDFFKGRQDVSPSRLDRRQIQSDLYEKFKQEQMKPVTGTGGTLFQSRTPGGPTLADKAQELAFKYGPTPRELLGDIGYGIGSIGKGLGKFIGKGGVIGSVLSGLYDKFKSGTQQGIETVGDLYDNLRNIFKGESQFVPSQAPGGLYEGQPIRTGIEALAPQFPYNFETIMKPRPESLQPSEMSQEQFMESFPELYSGDSSFKNIGSFNINTYQPGYLPEGFSNVSIENPLFRNLSYEPIRVSDMNMTGVTAENERPVLPPNVIPMMRVGEPMNINQYRTPVLPPDITDPRLYQNQVLFAKDGGSVDKYAGLGYKFK